MGRPRKYTPKQMAEIAIDVVSGKRKIEEVATTTGLPREQVEGWTATLIRHADRVFATDAPAPARYQKRIANLEQIIGRLVAESQMGRSERLPEAEGQAEEEF